VSSTTVRAMVRWSGELPVEAEKVASRVRGGDLWRCPSTRDLSLAVGSGGRPELEAAPAARGERRGGERGGLLHFAIITNGKHSKAILTIAPTDLPLLVETLLKYTLFAYVARQRVNFCLCAPSPLVPTHTNVDRNAKRPKHPWHLLLSTLLSSFFRALCHGGRLGSV
jgi:hypothetical protein